MKKGFATLLFLGWLMTAGISWAEPPVSAIHTLAGYSMMGPVISIEGGAL